jgi:hypothetical protein
MVEQPQNNIPEPVPQTWIPIAGGILSIVAGSMGMIAIAFLITFSATFGADIARDVLDSLGFWEAGMPLTIISLVAIPFVIINIVAMVGGVYAIRRRLWGLALAGAICTTVPSQLLGIPAIIFIAISRREFDQG